MPHYPRKKEIEGSVRPPDRRGRQTHWFMSKHRTVYGSWVPLEFCFPSNFCLEHLSAVAFRQRWVEPLSS